VTVNISSELLRAIHAHGEGAYPAEGCGLLLGKADGDARNVADLLPIRNGREPEAAHNRFLITPQDMLRGDAVAEERGMDVIGIFHSHPDHPAEPSQFDLDHALPWYSYIITTVDDGRAVVSRSWRLPDDDRSRFIEEAIAAT
jgi:proteasome lid subunit RPN8/RPN11